ncbi:MAG: hypothetical protein HY727_09930 [Candidatus Rokubacteria bacterium]|nr:hypothetical protein [Candidatus Rokubacteria bacterium]
MPLNWKKAELDSSKTLEKLVAAHAESIEPGLKILDANLLLGDTAVDLVGIDAGNVLVLVELGVTAGADMLLKMLEAYAWCLDHPDAVRRRYPMARIEPGWAPRVFFLAERLPESFLRQVKYLVFPEVECVEFRYLESNGTFAVYFHPVERLRRPARPTPPVPVPAPKAEAPPPAVATATVAPRQPAPVTVGPVKAPHLGEGSDLSRQWRKFLKQAETTFAAAKMRPVREYLQAAFPLCTVHDFYEASRPAQVFHVLDAAGQLVHQVVLVEEFLARHADEEIPAFLESQRLADTLRRAGHAAVLVTTAGLQVERQ